MKQVKQWARCETATNVLDVATFYYSTLSVAQEGKDIVRRVGKDIEAYQDLVSLYYLSSCVVKR